MRRPREPEFLRWVKAQPCAARSARQGEECDGAIEAHHAGPHGAGQKCPDRESIPLCTRHHREWHDARGLFAGMDKAARRVFAATAIELTQQAHDAQMAVLYEDCPF